MPADEIIVIEEDEGTSAEVEAVVEEPEEQNERVSIVNGKLVVLLDEPFETTFKKGGETRTEVIDRLTFRRPNGGDLQALASFTNQIEQSVLMFCRLTGLHNLQFAKLDQADIEFCMESLQDFLSCSPKTGKK